jgi:outer membrane protein OmpA-like peptidoglycan-associated protein
MKGGKLMATNAVDSVKSCVTIGLAALGFVLYFFCGRVPDITDPAVTKRIAKMSLDHRTSLPLREGSLNQKVAGFLANATDNAVPKTFTFDNSSFEFGSSTLTAESMQMLNDLADLAATLKAHASAQVRLDGYTDNVGDPVESKQLSLARANMAKEILVQLGIDPSRISTAGHGQEREIASNDTEENRARNPLIELVVLRK